MNLDSFNLTRYLANLPLFSDMSEQDLSNLAHNGCTLRNLERGEHVFVTGQPCGEFHVVVTGQVRLYVHSPQGMEKVIELLGPQQSFAEALMFTGQRYILSAQTLTDATILTISRDVVLAEIHKDAGFALRLMAGMSRRLHGLVRDVEANALSTGMQRVIGYLLGDLATRADEMRRRASAGEFGNAPPAAMTVTLPVAKAVIASRLSLTPEYLSRVFNELERVGLIRVDRRDILILDPDKLSAYGSK